jgi:ubiquinone/menaquinone biosynthesis C-methylase UbiE
MTEAYRVLKPGGLLWVKCQDEIESGRQRWTHMELQARAVALGFVDRDMALLIQKAAPLQFKRQLHLRKNHSYLLILEKPLSTWKKEAS